MSQIFNPYLPLYEYVPDGEPHRFDGRVYIYGSHDQAQGTKYCQGHYVVWSAPEDDLTQWRYEGVSYRRTQDPSNANDEMQLWAPDVTRGPDGRYYLYYCFSFYPEIGVAVSDAPAGPFEFYGHVKYPAHIEGGKTLNDFMPFDPAVLTDEDGRVYLYYGFATKESQGPAMPPPDPAKMSPEERAKFEEMRKRFANRPRMVLSEGAMIAELEPDMLTLKEVPHVGVPGLKLAEGTPFEGHGFFEASSIRRVGQKYYFVYSSQKSHELCYAVSDRPDRDFVYGGTIVSNGDLGLNGRTTPVYTVGNNHGGMVEANGAWYIFYHRQTNGTEFSRQGCAERIEIRPDGGIAQVEITSCGLNGGPLEAAGTYPAAICCHLTSPTTSARINYQDPVMKAQARVTEDASDAPLEERVQYITAIADGVKVGYKYFDFRGAATLTLTLRGSFRGTLTVADNETMTQPLVSQPLDVASDSWTELTVQLPAQEGAHALYLAFAGEGALDLRQLRFA